MGKAAVLKVLDQMAIPAIAAPMFLVSNPALALACCAEGIMGTFPTHGLLFVGLLVGVVLIVGGLTYLPALALGPIVDHLSMMAGALF